METRGWQGEAQAGATLVDLSAEMKSAGQQMWGKWEEGVFQVEGTARAWNLFSINPCTCAQGWGQRFSSQRCL